MAFARGQTVTFRFNVYTCQTGTIYLWLNAPISTVAQNILVMMTEFASGSHLAIGVPSGHATMPFHRRASKHNDLPSTF